MRERKEKVLFALILLLSATFAAGALSRSPQGGYDAVSVEDGEVVRAGKYAVRAERKNSGEMLTELKILSAMRQVVNGTNYRICLSVKRSGTSRTAEAIVYRSLKNERQLMSWVWKDCG